MSAEKKNKDTEFFRDDLDSRPVLVTVDCLVYNHGPYLRDSLEAFVSQKTDFRYEVIVHDDCSTDDSLAILNEYAQRYPSIIKVLSETENLYSQGGNKLINAIRPYRRGKYLAYCEGDDYWIDPLKLQKQVDYMEAHPECGLCYTRAKKYFHDKDKFICEFGGRAETFDQLLRANTIPALTVMARMELVDEYIDAPVPRQNWYMGDYPQWLWIAKDHDVHFIDEVTSVYRILHNSASHPTRLDKFLRFENNAVDIKLFFVNLCHLDPEDYITLQDIWVKVRWAIITDDKPMLREYYAKAKQKGLRGDLLMLVAMADKGGRVGKGLAKKLLNILFKKMQDKKFS